MTRKTYSLGTTHVELLTEGSTFVGLGQIRIGDVLVRSGRLPIRPYTQSFTGWELSRLDLAGVDETRGAIRIRLAATFKPLEVQLLRDHSFDPIHDVTDWDAPQTQQAKLDLVIEPASERFDRYRFDGFSYRYEYDGPEVPIFYLYDRASWELDGNIEGATVFNQSACSDPVVTFKPDTTWSTEGILFFLVEQGNANPIMTHNLPRWADHQAWDYQFKDGRTLIGVYDRVELIRSVLRREAGKPELKCFDKHIFDETTKFTTARKQILINQDRRSLVAEQNLWTWMFDELHERARKEFGLKEQPPVPLTGHHYWTNYNIDTSYRDIVPAAEAIGARAIFTENFKRSDASERNPLISGNMCCSHEYEISPEMGGQTKFTDYVARCHKKGIKNFMWTNTYVSLQAKMNQQQRDERGWYMAMEDTRIKYGGAYTMVSSNLDLKSPEARAYWVEAHRKLAKETGVDGFYLDSFYNLFFMPVNYKTGHPRTSWREALAVMKELQDDGVGWYIESFGPWGQPGHGHHKGYSAEKIFICYYVGLGDNSVTVPVPGMVDKTNISHDAGFVYFQLAHKVPPPLPCFIDGKRIDEVFGDLHRRALREYHELLPDMHRRYLQEDGLGVIWHNRERTRALLWNFAERTVSLRGNIKDLSTGQDITGPSQRLEPLHTYEITGTDLPVSV